jgi:hypothetical protein
MAEEAKDAAGDPVITPPGMHRPDDMAVDVPEDVDHPPGVNPEGQTTPTSESATPPAREGGEGGTGLKVPGTT